jgi:hypothetical protein
METAGSTETLIAINRATWHHGPEDCALKEYLITIIGVNLKNISLFSLRHSIEPPYASH